MIKAKVFDIANSNIENLGSDLERKIKEAAAATEAAWEGAGQEPGLKIWRIEKFQVKDWPESQYGEFHTGDSYIVFHTYKEDGEEELQYDIHFWLGQETTQDEAGTAAYKTVELDTLLKDKPIQHREVEGFESPLFLQYFPRGVVLLEGGVESGFNHVEPEKYEPRLLHVKGKFGSLQVRQVPLEVGSLNSGDVFVLDAGLKVYQFNGATSGAFEKRKAAEVVSHIKSQRGAAKSEVVDDGDDHAEFWEYFGGKQEISPGGDDDDLIKEKPKKLYRLSDNSGDLQFELVAENKLSRDLLDTNDVFVVDLGHSIYTWIGANASTTEKAHGMKYAQQYSRENYGNLPVSISLVHERGCPASVYSRFL